MFGIFYGIYNAVMAGINGIDKNFQNSTDRAKAMDSGDITYFSRGQMFLTKNGRQVVKSWDRYTGHDVIKDIRNGKVYYDLTKYKNEQFFKQCKKEGKTAIELGYPNVKNYQGVAHKLSFKTRWHVNLIDIETKHYLSEIIINNYEFYFDVMTGYLLRLSDQNTKDLEWRTERGDFTRFLFNKNYTYETYIMSPNDIIRLFNKRQEKLKEDINFKNKNEEWIRTVFYLHRVNKLEMNKDGTIYRFGNGTEPYYEIVDGKKINMNP